MIYLDNAASSLIHPLIKENLQKIYELYYNGSSSHKMGLKSREVIEELREKIANYLRVKKSEIFFTSGASESNNWVINYLLDKNINIYMGNSEHPSVNVTIKNLKKDINYISKNDLTLLKDDSFLIMMDINNETGIKNYYEADNMIYFSDMVQSFLKYELNIKERNISFATMSAHKLGAFKGLGLLYKKENINLKPLIYGGNQEMNMRAGTSNIQSIYSFQLIIDDLIKNREEYTQRVKKYKELMINSLVDIDYPLNNTSDYILSISTCVPSEILMNSLSSKGVYVSNGSACHSKVKELSNSYKDINYKNKDGIIRISFSPFNSLDEIKRATKIINDEVKELKFMMGLK